MAHLQEWHKFIKHSILNKQKSWWFICFFLFKWCMRTISKLQLPWREIKWLKKRTFKIEFLNLIYWDNFQKNNWTNIGNIWNLLINSWKYLLTSSYCCISALFHRNPPRANKIILPKYLPLTATTPTKITPLSPLALYCKQGGCAWKDRARPLKKM